MSKCICEKKNTNLLKHQDFCENAVVSSTKGEVRELFRNIARMAIEDYQLLIKKGMPAEDAKIDTIVVTDESVYCFLKLGSCARGCKH